MLFPLEKDRNAHKIEDRKTEAQKPLEKLKCRWE